MIEAFEEDVRLSMPIKAGGVSRRTHLERVEKMTGRRPAALNTKPVPEEMQYLVDMFWDLKRSQQPITYQEIDAWARLCHNQPEPQEARLLMALDGVVAKVQREAAE